MKVHDVNSKILLFSVSIFFSSAFGLKVDAAESVKPSAAVAAKSSAAEAPKVGASEGASKPDDSGVGWSELEKTCESNWSKFEQDINSLRKSLARDLGALSQKQYSKLEEEDDPKITFMSATWPADLQEVDEFWSTHKECATMHWEVRKALASPAVAKEKREEIVTRWEGCLLTHYSKKKLLPPLDRLVSCYKKRAAAPN